MKDGENKIEKEISRLDLKEKIQEYINKNITLEDLQNWELEISRKDFSPNDWEGDDSLINEILHQIDMSDIDGLSIEKAKEIIKLLKSNENTKILIKRLYSMN